jgi:hypothetical protein
MPGFLLQIMREGMKGSEVDGGAEDGGVGFVGETVGSDWGWGWDWGRGWGMEKFGG